MYSFEVLKKKIDEFIKGGGDIYLPRRQLPYYSYLHKYKKELEELDGKEYTIADIYRKCGIDFDKEYYIFSTILDELEQAKDDEGFVEEVRKQKNIAGSTINRLSHFSRRYDISPYDFLVFMTGLRFKEANIQVDYIALLQKELLKAYPNRNIQGIRREHPVLYEKIRHVRKYLPIRMSMAETLDYLGFYNEKATNNLKEIPNKLKVLRLLKVECPDHNASLLYTKNKPLYYDIVRLAIASDKTINQWLSENGYTYITKADIPRLSLAKVDEPLRYKTVTDFEKKHFTAKTKRLYTKQEIFHKKIELIPELIEYLDSKYTDIDETNFEI